MRKGNLGILQKHMRSRFFGRTILFNTTIANLHNPIGVGCNIRFVGDQHDRVPIVMETSE
jgi:hypothetical protein